MASTTNKRLFELSDEELGRLLDLVGGADSVELKLTVPESHQATAAAALGLDPLEAQIRQVFFFDTPDLALNRSGLVVRARRVQGRGDDTVIKLRPVVPADIPAHQRQSPSMVVELDAMPGGYVCSASLKRRLERADVRRAVAGEHPIRKLFSKEQRAFYAEHAPEGVELDQLSVLGPIFVLKLKFAPEGAPSKVVVEVWQYPDGTRILELSTKCAPADMFGVAVRSRSWLAERGVDLSGEQQTKTKTALEAFTREQPAAAAAG
jgi:hypothetical protein